MDFTREPIVETVISARDGHRIVVRSSKNPGQEEFFVDALEIVTFHSGCFYRCLERPRAFLVPVSDYEVLEVREPRLPLKTPSLEGVQRLSAAASPMGRNESVHSHVKGNQERVSTSPLKNSERESYDSRRRDVKESLPRDAMGDKKEKGPKGFETKETVPLVPPALESEQDEEIDEVIGSISNNGESETQEGSTSQTAYSQSLDRRRDRRRNLRKKPLRNGAKSDGVDDVSTPQSPIADETKKEVVETRETPVENVALKNRKKRSEATSSIHVGVTDDTAVSGLQSSTLMGSILPPPSTLIRDDLARMRNSELYKGAFYIRDEEKKVVDSSFNDSSSSIQEVMPLKEPALEVQNNGDDFILSSSLRFDDDDDMQTNSYIAKPVVKTKPEA